MNLRTSRVMQLYWALIAPLVKLDHQSIRHELSSEEYRLFLSMSKIDQYHSFRVYQTVLRLLDGYESSDECNHHRNTNFDTKHVSALKKAALLHDIGRKDGDLPILQKVWVVVQDYQLKKKPASEQRAIKQMIFETEQPPYRFTYYFHPQKSKKRLEQITDDATLLFLVEQHHTSIEQLHSEGFSEIDVCLLQFLQRADELN
ncbi:hypothetical protein BHU72_01850 [Desulfuribacillus stibiiarsenatis]|uniref:HD domain-containing protein n=1 Tax=Desulfuribacillus stibiiarsenatis TaxID=1390249 RepID=A0A1E5LA88_9FIRM|nr:hypothetical protein [Desulfuribacillus stibiiarsenatis]OEH87022.1 hypothetical protein BHU72_01850 [Desulfuribacillus stibiiarsenatis]